MKLYDSAIPDAIHPQPQTPLAVQALGGGAALFVVTFVLLGLVLEVDMTRTLKTGAILGCVPLLLLAVSCLSCVAEAMLERLTGRDLNGSGEIGDNVDRRQFIFTQDGPSARISREKYIPLQDLEYMIKTLKFDRQTGWKTRDWDGRALPSGYHISKAGEDVVYLEFITFLERIGALIDRSEGRAGKLVMHEAEILTRAGLS